MHAAEKLGISRIIPGFLDPNLRLAQLRRGVSFASGGSGYDDSTANRIVSHHNMIAPAIRSISTEM
jgi:hypothetical protein